MADPGDPTGPSDRPLYTSRRRQRRTSNTGRWILALLVLVIGAGIGWYWFGYRIGDEAPERLPTAATPGDTTGEAMDTLVDLPPMEESDPFVRDMVNRLSDHPRLAAWLATDQLVQRFVTTVVNVAEGQSPVEQVPFMEPEGEFRVRESGDALIVDPASYRRYDVLTETFLSLETQRAVRLYRQMRPLFQEAYRELGFQGSFDDVMARAIGNVLAVEVPEEPIRVVPSTEAATAWAFGDSALEGRPPAEKHLIRMGPQNARRIQEKLRALADGLGLQVEVGGGPGG